MSKNHNENIEPNPPEWLADYKNIGTVLVSKSLYHKYVEYLFEIDSLLRKDKPIPASLAKRFFALQQTDKQIAGKKNKVTVKKRSKIGIDKTMQYFNKCKDEGYLFAGQYKEQYKEFSFLHIFNDIERETKERDMPYSFQEMIASCIHSYLFFHEDLSRNKQEIIKYFFELIEDYCNRRGVSLDDFSDYKKKVVAAYLTMFIADIPLWHKEKVISVSTGRNKRDIKTIFAHFRNSDLHEVAYNAIKYKKKT